MILKMLALGVSVIALAAGPGYAQTTNVNEVSQSGSRNTAAVQNNDEGNDFNRSSVIQSGNDNRVTVLQIGDSNISTARQVGDENQIVHTQRPEGHSAESIQDGDGQRSAIRQLDQSNEATVDQEGDRNTSLIAQGIDSSGAGFTTADFFNVGAGQERAGEDNEATVDQDGSDLFSTIRQRASAGGAAADDNVARIEQVGSGSTSTLTQQSRGNLAEVYQFQGGNTEATRNFSIITQQNSAATDANNPLSGNDADVAISGFNNAAMLTQDGRNNNARITMGLGSANRAQISQVGDLGVNRVGVAQYGDLNTLLVAQNSAGAEASVWQRPGAAANRSRNNDVTIQQGTGTTGTDAFSASFFNNNAATGNATQGLDANIVQGIGSGSTNWNIAQIRQDGIDLSATIDQAGSGSSNLPNRVRIAQQGNGNEAIAIQLAGVGPSSASDTTATGRPGDPYYFAGGARSAEIAILQSGNNNSARIEQRGLGQFARIEQGPGGDNVATILQDAAALNATAIILQTGSNNSYDVVQNSANQYILVSQTGDNNTVTDVVER